MDIKEPIYIGGYTDIELCIAAWYSTEPDDDEFAVVYSHNAVNWTWGYYETGYIGVDYLTELSIDMDVSSYAESLYISFNFWSDYSVCGYEGAYVDNIEVWAYLAMPDLVPYAPAGWSGKIVVSSVPGTNTSNKLYVDGPAYIDLATINWGD